MAPWGWFMWTETCWSSFYNFNYFNNLKILKFLCISWTINCLILLMHGATMKFNFSVDFPILNSMKILRIYSDLRHVNNKTWSFLLRPLHMIVIINFIVQRFLCTFDTNSAGPISTIHVRKNVFTFTNGYTSSPFYAYPLPVHPKFSAPALYFSRILLYLYLGKRHM